MQINKLNLLNKMIGPLKNSQLIRNSSNKSPLSTLNHYLPLNNKQSNKKQSKLKINQSKQIHNLSSSRISKLSSKSTRIESTQFHIKLPHAFYNDSKTSFYLNKSKTMSQKSLCYQVRPLSLTQRNKMQSLKLESIVKRRKTQIENDQNLQNSFQKNITSKLPFNQSRRSQSSINLQYSPNARTSYLQSNNLLKAQQLSSAKIPFIKTQRASMKDKFKNYTFEKYNKLIYGQKLKQIEQKMLKKDISNISSSLKSINKKWYGPYQNSNSIKSKYQGKKIISTSPLKQRQQYLGNRNKLQIKVLNIDRMFRKKEGRLTNVIPLPLPKFSQVTAKKNINLIANKKNKDKIHDIIDQFNNLLKISKLKKAQTTKILGVKGKNFTKNPTFQQLMGLKLKPKTNIPTQQSQQIPTDIFIQYSSTYKEAINQNFQLTNNLIDGIKQTSKAFNLQVLTRYYSLFVNKVATIEQKVKFFSFFFIPYGKELIFKSQLIEIFVVLCKSRNLPAININVKTELLSQEQKGRIFLQALLRVMFGQVLQDEVMNRQMFGKILRQNEQAIDLLIKLIQKKQ